MYEKILILPFFIILLISCSNKEPFTEETFKSLHKGIYDAWELTEEEELSNLLQTVASGPFYEEQFNSQLNMLKARLETNEEHKVETITYHELKIVESSDIEAVVYTDYTIEGYRFHGDYHEQKSSHRIYWRIISTIEGWRINEISY